MHANSAVNNIIIIILFTVLNKKCTILFNTEYLLNKNGEKGSGL